MEEAQANYLRPETLQRATARLVNFHLRQPLAQAWGQGLTSSSDAQVYAVPVRALNATFHPKYFASAGRGVAVYTHVSDLWIPFYTQVITCHVRQAPYILDGLLYHTTHLQPTEHYTDTHGYTDLIFGVTHLLGIRFAPRIKDLPEQRLWRLPEGGPYQHIESALAGNLNVNLIRDTWDEMLRMAASVLHAVVLVARSQVAPPSTDTSTRATVPPPASFARPATLTVVPVDTVAPCLGDVIIEIGVVKPGGNGNG